MNDELLRDPITGELPRRRHPTWFWIAFGSLVLAVLLTVGSWILSSVLRLTGSGRLPPRWECGYHHGHDSILSPRPGDRAALMTPADLPGCAGLELDPARETVDRIHYGDCSLGVAYAYLGREFQVESSVVRKRTIPDAQRLFAAALRDRPEHAAGDELFRWGDDSALWFETRGGEPFGCIFIGRRGERVVRARWSGTAFEPPTVEELAAFLGPIVERMVEHEL